MNMLLIKGLWWLITYLDVKSCKNTICVLGVRFSQTWFMVLDLEFHGFDDSIVFRMKNCVENHVIMIFGWLYRKPWILEDDE